MLFCYGCDEAEDCDCDVGCDWGCGYMDDDGGAVVIDGCGCGNGCGWGWKGADCSLDWRLARGAWLSKGHALLRHGCDACDESACHSRR